MANDLERFAAKCEFMPGSGCVLWRGGTTSSRDGTERTGVFWANGKKQLARRWAAKNIHGMDLLGKETTASCGDPLCVQHVKAETPPYYHRMAYVLRNLGYGEIETRTEHPDHSAAPFHSPPDWYVQATAQNGPGYPINDEAPF